MCRGKMTKNNDILKEHSLKPVGCTFAMQYEDGGPGTNGTVIAHNDVNQ